MKNDFLLSSLYVSHFITVKGELKDRVMGEGRVPCWDDRKHHTRRPTKYRCQCVIDQNPNKHLYSP